MSVFINILIMSLSFFGMWYKLKIIINENCYTFYIYPAMVVLSIIILKLYEVEIIDEIVRKIKNDKLYAIVSSKVLIYEYTTLFDIAKFMSAFITGLFILCVYKESLVSCVISVVCWYWLKITYDNIVRNIEMEIKTHNM